MTNMIRCYRCGGQGRAQGMGWIEVECPTCKGKCKIEKPTSSFDTTMNSQSVSCGTSEPAYIGDEAEHVPVVSMKMSSKRPQSDKRVGKNG